MLRRHHAEAGCVHVPDLPTWLCLSVGLPGPFQAACGEPLSRRCPPRSTARPNFKVPVKSISEKEAGQWARPGTDEVSGRRHGSQDTVVGCAAELRRMDERGWRLSGQVGPQQPRSSRADVPVPQLNDAQLSVIRFTSTDATSFPSCLAHRAQAGREYHPHLSACATAAAVLCGFPQIWRVSLRVCLRVSCWAPKTAELHFRILMVFPRGRGLGDASARLR